MFDLSIPIMVNGNLGDSIILFDEENEYERCRIYIADGVRIIDLVRIWHVEAAAISRGNRKRGMLPVYIARNREGQLGCGAAWVLFREGEQVHIFDGTVNLAEKYDTFGNPPQDWWRCLRLSNLKYCHKSLDVWKRTVSVSDLAEWADRLFTIIGMSSSTAEVIKDAQEVTARNRTVLLDLLQGFHGGREFISIFPEDFMERMGMILRDGYWKQKLMIGDLCFDEFDMKLHSRRDKEQLGWWIRMVFQHGDMVVFLDPHGNAGKGVPLFVLRPGDDVAGMLPEMLEKTRISSEAVDHVAFSARCDLPELSRCSGHVVLAKAQYCRLLKDASRVLLGVCKGTAWTEFPLGEIVRKPIPPLFENETNRY